MGMFDSVFVTCPKCGKQVEFQSKVGDCNLNSYTSDCVPILIALDLDGDSEECSCGNVVRIKPVVSIDYMAMIVI